MKNEILNEISLKKLIECGWYPNRKVNLKEKKKILEGEGWIIFDYALEILENMEGLYSPNHDIIFDVMDGTFGEKMLAEELRNLTNEETVIIGEIFMNSLIIGESRNIYIADFPNIYYVANGIEDALNKLFDIVINFFHTILN